METWVPLMEFAIRRGISTSTIRRKIKNNSLRYKQENGRYLICDDAWNEDGGSEVPGVSFKSSPTLLTFAEKSLHSLQSLYGDIIKEKDQKIERLEEELAKSKDELSEQQMLVKILEENSR